MFGRLKASGGLAAFGSLGCRRSICSGFLGICLARCVPRFLVFRSFRVVGVPGRRDVRLRGFGPRWEEKLDRVFGF